MEGRRVLNASLKPTNRLREKYLSSSRSSEPVVFFPTGLNKRSTRQQPELKTRANKAWNDWLRNDDRFSVAFIDDTRGRAAAARRRGAEGIFTRADIEALFREQSGFCATPGCSSTISVNSPMTHIDHKIPVSRGGTNWPDNLQLLCRYCNCAKCDMTMDEWIRYRAARNG